MSVFIPPHGIANATRFIDSLAEVECVICEDPFSDAHKAVIVPGCRHVFGVGCLRRWIHSNNRAHNRCPICRAVLFDDGVPVLGENGGRGRGNRSSGGGGAASRDHHASIRYNRDPLPAEDPLPLPDPLWTRQVPFGPRTHSPFQPPEQYHNYDFEPQQILQQHQQRQTRAYQTSPDLFPRSLPHQLSIPYRQPTYPIQYGPSHPRAINQLRLPLARPMTPAPPTMPNIYRNPQSHPRHSHSQNLQNPQHPTQTLQQQLHHNVPPHASRTHRSSNILPLRGIGAYSPNPSGQPTIYQYTYHGPMPFASPPSSVENPTPARSLARRHGRRNRRQGSRSRGRNRDENSAALSEGQRVGEEGVDADADKEGVEGREEERDLELELSLAERLAEQMAETVLGN